MIVATSNYLVFKMITSLICLLGMTETLDSTRKPDSISFLFHENLDNIIISNKTNQTEKIFTEIKNSTQTISAPTENSRDTNMQEQSSKFNRLTSWNNRARRSSRPVCPELTIGQCPDLSSYPECRMMRITSTCPWKLLINGQAECLTNKPCFGIDKTQPNLQCKPFFYVDHNNVLHPIACLAVIPEIKLADPTESDVIRTPQEQLANKPVVG